MDSYACKVTISSFGSLLGALLATCPAAAAAEKAPRPIVMTVRGPVPYDKLGRTLMHEHVMCDFIGAAKTGPERWDPDRVVRTMEPHLWAVKKRGFTTFVDNTPAYIGRDPRVLRRLSESTGLHLVTNTGYYGAAKDKYLPAHAQEETAAELARRWIVEWKDGIGTTGIRPGFIKIGVDHGPLSAVDRKLVRAAALTHLETGLTIACHTGESQAATEVLDAIEKEGVMASALIVVHADSIRDHAVHLRLAARGAWVEYDGVGGKPTATHVEWVRSFVEQGLEGRLLLSHDAGWYQVGEESRPVRPYTALSDQLVPALLRAGVEEKTIDRILVENPRQALAVRQRQRSKNAKATRNHALKTFHHAAR